MIPKPPDQENPWETPSLEPNLELIESSHRLVELPEDAIHQDTSPSDSQDVSAKNDSEVRIAELEAQNQYLFNRNVALVAKVAEIEVLNRRLSEEIITLKKSARAPWFMRWLGRSS
jgi:molecular chaperone GrpE (heat shock protein)